MVQNVYLLAVLDKCLSTTIADHVAAPCCFLVAREDGYSTAVLCGLWRYVREMSLTVGKSGKIIEWFGLEGTFRGHPVQPLCNVQGHLQLNQVTQIPIQPGLERFQGWGICHLSGQPVPVSHHPHGKKCLPYIQSKSTFFEFKTITLSPIATGSAKEFVTIFLVSPLYVLKGRSKVSPEPSLLQAEQPQLSQPFHIGELFQPSDHCCGLLWTCSNRSVSVLC